MVELKLLFLIVCFLLFFVCIVIFFFLLDDIGGSISWFELGKEFINFLLRIGLESFSLCLISGKKYSWFFFFKFIIF